MYYTMRLGSSLGCTPSGDESKGCSPVPGEAPTVYYITFFFFGVARLGCIPSGDESKRWLARSWRGPVRVLYNAFWGETGLYSVWR